MTFKLKVLTKSVRFPTIPVIFSNFHRTGDQILEVNDEDLSTAGNRPNCLERDNSDKEGQEEDKLLL